MPSGRHKDHAMDAMDGISRRNIVTDVEASLPVEVLATDGDGQIDVTGGVDARHDANGSVLIDVRPHRVLRVEPADDLLSGAETRPRYVHHHSAHHVATLRGEHQRLRLEHR